jgi:hypothetical protein
MGYKSLIVGQPILAAAAFQAASSEPPIPPGASRQIQAPSSTKFLPPETFLVASARYPFSAGALNPCADFLWLPAAGEHKRPDPCRRRPRTLLQIVTRKPASAVIRGIDRDVCVVLPAQAGSSLPEKCLNSASRLSGNPGASHWIQLTHCGAANPGCSRLSGGLLRATNTPGRKSSNTSIALDEIPAARDVSCRLRKIPLLRRSAQPLR